MSSEIARHITWEVKQATTSQYGNRLRLAPEASFTNREKLSRYLVKGF